MPSNEADVPPAAEPESAPAPASTPASTPMQPPAIPARDAEVADDSAKSRPSPREIRSLVGLLDCPLCTKPVVDPVTLPCGRTLCKSCLPRTRQRPNVSYPDTPERLFGFPCPFLECARTHARGDCSVDITFRNVASRLRAELQGTQRGEAGEAAGRNADLPVAADSATKVPRQSYQGKSVVAPDGTRPETCPEAEQDGGSHTTTQDIAVAETEAGLVDRVRSSVRDELLCQICFGLLCDPSTTPCGHTYCWHCLSCALDTVPSCPTCRRSLATMSLSCAATDVMNKALSAIVNTLWPAELRARRRSIAAEEEGRDRPEVPVFVCTVSFPSMPMMLHVFEARYRLLVQRALEDDRTFGMVASRGGRNETREDIGFREVGTMLRITHIEFFPDGRSILETVGLYRFRIRSYTMVDGYVMAKIDRIDDISIVDEEDREAREIEAARLRLRQHIHAREEAGEVPMEEEEHDHEHEEGHEDDEEEDVDDNPEDEGISLSRQTTSTIATLVGEPESVQLTSKSTLADLDAAPTRELIRFVETHLKERPERSIEWLTNRLVAIYGEQPSDPALLPWWFASIHPLRPKERQRLLEATSVRERIKMCCAWIIEMNQGNGLQYVLPSRETLWLWRLPFLCPSAGGEEPPARWHPS